MAKVKSYMNPNIPKPKPGKDNPDARVKTGPVKPNPPVRRKGPGGGPKQPAPPRKDRGIRNPIGKKPGGTLIDKISDFARKQRQLPTRVKPEGRRQKSSDMGKTARNGRTKPGTRGR
jgi:hypothetical protein